MSSDKPISPESRLQQHYQLLQLEYEYEKESYFQRSQTGGISRKIQQGLCWYPVKAGRSYYNPLNLPVIEIEKENEDDTEHNFEAGLPVCFFTPDTAGQQRYFNFTATISYVQDNKIIVVLPDAKIANTLQQCRDLGIQLYFDETSYQTMFTALKEVIRAKNDRLAVLKDALLGTYAPRRRDIFPLRFPWLNPKQEETVNHVLAAREVAIIHGPPGTGKTTTLVEAIHETLHKENQVMVCAQSNTAVDWIAEKLTDRGINVLRIGNPTRVNDKMLSFTYERRFESHPEYPELWNIRKAVRDLRSQSRKQNRENRHSLYDKLSKLRNRATDIEIRIREQLFSESRVIACTLVGSANKLLAGMRFSTLFIDEAAQSLEAACWIAICKADRVILAGDYFQLPPTIKCIEAARQGLDKTLMQKVSERKPETVSLLEIQYRMHEDIMTFPSRWFYHNRLHSAPEVKYRGILEFDTPIVWHDTSGSEPAEETAGETRSRLNKTEGRLLIHILKEYIEKIGTARILEEQIDFGLISPYKAQIRYIRQLLKADPFFRPFRSLLSVNTVDGFQGQERDVIFISLVRANTQGEIGFLSDLRRMNVAITRARMKLNIIGDSSTLSRHPFYRSLFHYIEEKGAIQPTSLS